MELLKKIFEIYVNILGFIMKGLNKRVSTQIKQKKLNFENSSAYDDFIKIGNFMISVLMLEILFSIYLPGLMPASGSIITYSFLFLVFIAVSIHSLCTLTGIFIIWKQDSKAYRNGEFQKRERNLTFRDSINNILIAAIWGCVIFFPLLWILFALKQIGGLG